MHVISLGQLQIKHSILNIYIDFYFLLKAHRIIIILLKNAHAKHSLIPLSALFSP